MTPFQVLRRSNHAASGAGASGIRVGTLLETATTPGSVPMPAYVAGDVVFVQIFKADAGGHPGSTTPPSGWTLVANVNTFANSASHQVYRRVMTGSEGSSVSFDWVTAGAVNAQAIAVSGVNTTGAITEGVATNGGTTSFPGTESITAGTVTTLGTNRLILNFFGTARGTNGTMAEAADAWTDVYQNATSSQSLTPHTAASKQVAAVAQAYTPETRTETASGASIFWNSISFAVIML